MMNALRLRTRLTLAGCVVLVALAVRVCDCMQRPIITWNRFTAALKRSDLALANSLCDQATVKVGSLDRGALMLAVTSDTQPWSPWPIIPLTLDEFMRYYTVHPTGWTERLRSRVRIGNPGSVWWGHLEVHGGTVVFRSDIRGE